MKKLLAIACAVSAVALTSAAFADGASITLSAPVNAAIVVTSAGSSATQGQGAADVTSGTGLARTVSLNSFFDSSTMKTNYSTGTTIFNVTSNTNFKASVTSENGGLLNGSNPRIDYTVGVNGSKAPSSSLIGGGDVSATVNNAGGGTQPVAVEYHVAPGAQVAMGSYSDVLRLSISAY